MKPNLNIYIALVHYPIRNKTGDIVTTAITNLDIHDIARTARTFGIKKYFIVNPLESQIMITERILNYWATSKMANRMPDRQDALKTVRITDKISNVIEYIQNQTGKLPIQVSTDARENTNTLSYAALQNIIDLDERPVLILFGTGYGLTPDILNNTDYRLEPIRGVDGFNHLSVRAAVAIILDRLLSSGNIAPVKNAENNINIKEEKYASCHQGY